MSDLALVGGSSAICVAVLNTQSQDYENNFGFVRSVCLLTLDKFLFTFIVISINICREKSSLIQVS
jgi:hypothetical protein